MRAASCSSSSAALTVCAMARLFSPAMLAVNPSKDNLWTIKFVPDEQQLAPTIAACSGSVVEIYDFYKDTPLDNTLVPKARGLHSIKSNSAYLLQEVMQA